MKRIAALMLSVCLLCLLCGCSRERAAILCVYEAQQAGAAMCAQDYRLSCALAQDDEAAMGFVHSGTADFALVTAKADVPAEMEHGDVWLSAFAILSGAGQMEEWSTHTRVTVIGRAGDYGDVLAQQALTCALHGSVRYASPEEALEALQHGRTDVVMGMVAPGDARAEAALRQAKDVQLLDMPESLIYVKLPDECMQPYTLTLAGQQAQTYALPGILVLAVGKNSRAVEDSAAKAAVAAGLMR